MTRGQSANAGSIFCSTQPWGLRPYHRVLCGSSPPGSRLASGGAVGPSLRESTVVAAVVVVPLLCGDSSNAILCCYNCSRGQQQKKKDRQKKTTTRVLGVGRNSRTSALSYFGRFHPPLRGYSGSRKHVPAQIQTVVTRSPPARRLLKQTRQADQVNGSVPVLSGVKCRRCLLRHRGPLAVIREHQYR
jgi:hypothetical protein